MLINGLVVARQLQDELRGAVETLVERGATPGLAVVLIGDDPASSVYVRNKVRRSVEVGLRSFHHELPASTSESDLLALIKRLNAAEDVDGILVQLPLPSHIDAQRVTGPSIRRRTWTVSIPIMSATCRSAHPLWSPHATRMYAFDQKRSQESCRAFGGHRRPTPVVGKLYCYHSALKD